MKEMVMAGHQIQKAKMVRKCGQNKQKSGILENFFQKMNFQKMSKFDKLNCILLQYCILYNIIIVLNLGIHLGDQFYQFPKLRIFYGKFDTCFMKFAIFVYS